MKLKCFASKALALILTVLTVMGAFVIIPQKTGTTASADAGFYTWSGYSTYLKGAGSETSPFLISTPSDLAYFRKQVAASDGMITYYANDDTSTSAKTKAADTAYYKLTCDIYYNDPNGDEWRSWSATVTPTNGGGSVHTWAPPGYGDESTRRFEGHFDGGGYTIYGLYIVHADKNCVGFLGSVRYGTIANLTLSKGFVKGANLVGGFIGQARAGVDVVNCTSYLRVRGTTGVGGIIGGNAQNGSYVSTDVDITKEGNIPSVSVYKCINKASVSGTSFVGGIFGFVSAGASRVQIEHCSNSATITTSTSGAGGILGGTRQVDGYGHNLVRDCSNSGKIVGGTGNYAGGIVGCGRATDIYSCVNNGAVTMTGNYAGGISGGNNTANPLANGKIMYCYNSGSVTGTTYSGGIAGVAKSININMCGNVGDIKGTSYVGGISGKSGGSSDKRDTELYDCYNTGSVTSTDNSASVAGIIGEAYCEGTVSDNKYVKVMRCINLGAVSSGRAIAYTSSTLKTDSGTSLFAYQYASTCFGVSGIHTNFDGATAVSSLASADVLAVLNASQADTWSAGYPFPTLNSIDYSVQNYNGRAELLGGTTVSVSPEVALSLAATVNTAGSYYSSLGDKNVSYGVLAIKSSALGEAVLTAEAAGAVECGGTLSGNAYTAVFSGQTVDEYDDMYTFRPYAKFTVDGHNVYVYGIQGESSYYTANGAADVPAVNETAMLRCTEKMYVLVGGRDTLEYSLSSATREDSLSFVSSNTSVATVSSNGNVYGVSPGTATVSVTYTGAWGAKTLMCEVTVLSDLAETVMANQYASTGRGLRLRTNTLKQIHNSITKNDGFVLDYNGSVFLVDSGHNNDESLKYLKKLRAEYLKDGLDSGVLTEAEYYRRLLSNNCKIEINSFITHWHSDHVYGLRYHISKSPMVTVKTMYTLANPTGTSAAGYANYVNGYNGLVAALSTYSPNMEVVRLAYTKNTVRYYGNLNDVSTSASDIHPVKINMMAPYDWSTDTDINKDSTAWNNCSSVWYLFEFGENKLLFTGDTFPDDVGTTYTGALTSGSTAVDYMLYKYKSVVDSSVDFLDCNHHARASYVENLFTVTQPSIVFAGVYYGQESVTFTNKAVTTASFYLGGDGGHVFVFEPTGNVNTDGAICAYPMQASGKAVRNFVPIHYDLEAAEVSVQTEDVPVTGITLSSDSIKLVVGERDWLSATVLGEDATNKSVTWTVSDNSVATVDGAYVTAVSVGTVTVTASCGGYTASCTVTVVLAEGDINKDGSVTTSDAMLLKLVLMETVTADSDMTLNGDVDHDGALTLTDYALLLFMLKKGL